MREIFCNFNWPWSPRSSYSIACHLGKSCINYKYNKSGGWGRVTDLMTCIYNVNSKLLTFLAHLFPFLGRKFLGPPTSGFNLPNFSHLSITPQTKRSIRIIFETRSITPIFYFTIKCMHSFWFQNCFRIWCELKTGTSINV